MGIYTVNTKNRRIVRTRLLHGGSGLVATPFIRVNGAQGGSFTNALECVELNSHRKHRHRRDMCALCARCQAHAELCSQYPSFTDYPLLIWAREQCGAYFTASPIRVTGCKVAHWAFPSGCLNNSRTRKQITCSLRRHYPMSTFARLWFRMLAFVFVRACTCNLRSHLEL